MREPATYQVVQWGRILFTGTRQQCRETKKRWTEQHGNAELEVRKAAAAIRKGDQP